MKFFVIITFSLFCSLGLNAQTSSATWKAMEAEGDTLLNRQDFAGAIKIYNEVIELSKLKDSESKGVLYKRAICFYSTGEFQKALDDLQVFIPEFPGFPRAKLLRAFVNRELGNTQAQLDDINDLLSFNPTNPDLLKFKASIFLELEKYQEAKATLLNLQKVVNDEEIETQLGFIYSNLNEADSAFIHFDSALAINGGYSPAYKYLSSLCLDQGAYDMALTYVDIGLRLEPDNVTLQFYKGIALAETKNLKEGCRFLSKAFYAGMDQAGDYLKQYCYSAED
jgi:tetratricopeptide (TPR) repeat protein